MVDPDRKTGMDCATALRPADVDAEAIGRAAAENAVAKFGASSVDSGKYPVVIYRTELASLLSLVMSMASAETVQRGLSALGGTLGTQVGSKLVTIRDEPMVDGSIFNAPLPDSTPVRAPLPASSR